MKADYTITADLNTRAAGLLMHISSLPSPYGLGDFGPEARRFADFLTEARQTYWQLLPLNPVERNSAYSPYSSTSSMALNTLFISPEELLTEGLLQQEDLAAKVPVSACADFETAAMIRGRLLKKAYENFLTGAGGALRDEYTAFCDREAYWLKDFSLYVCLKDRFNGKSWPDWPEPYRLRNRQVLEELELSRAAELDFIRWCQYLANKQWLDLKAYCNARNLRLFGDMPFYVALDSADVWAHPSLFALSEDGTMLGVAGVPPDYFNSAGQLWGMPVFNWDAMEQQGYRWWIKRTERNMELFDLVRFDHFRAFSSYWEVPGGEETAINGRWLPGPGEKFFDMAYAALGRLPFVAEDLGDIDEAVYELRDRFNFPGMRVLQFAFGHDMDRSVHIPHNYTENSFVYTGTHDNNTSLGWYLSDIGTCERSNLEQYTGRLLTAARVPDELIKLAYSSRANVAIIPVQDVLCLNASARMNNPARPDGNWLWRLLPDQLHADHARKLAGCAEQCGR